MVFTAPSLPMGPPVCTFLWCVEKKGELWMWVAKALSCDRMD